ncbi:MAG: 50S ribosomal protein L15 [bacterium]
MHNLIKARSQKRRKRVGRGDSSGHGTYSGRGQKGQRSRSGGRQGIQRRTIKQLIARIPKSRGFTSFKLPAQVVNIGQLNDFTEGELITPEILVSRKYIKSPRLVKILGQGELKTRLTVKAHYFSQTAARAITKAGGSAVNLPAPKGPQPKKHQS